MRGERALPCALSPCTLHDHYTRHDAAEIETKMSQPTVSISLSLSAAISTARAAIGAAQEIDRQIEEREELGRYGGLQELRESASSLDRLATLLLAASQRDLNDDGEIVLTAEGERALAQAWGAQ